MDPNRQGPFRDLPHERVTFAHNAERQFASLLDFYGIGWQYEPTTFVLAEGADGFPILAFTPDFYLPEGDVYVEVTTLKQRLVTRKNRKLRLLRERHPDVDVRILYQRDYLELLVKYGLEPPSQLVDIGRRRGTSAGEGPSLLDPVTDDTTADRLDPRAGRRPTSAA